ncbi:MAG: bifunctional 23S rRNA (guanine(2069)-N(7))-methyltransferase RlmK/23S rRNA (guanine(2445)-N(2))-methyltransferase RlmL [Pseudomonadota bacterium]
MNEYLVTAPTGAADLLAAELAAQGAENCRDRPWGVTFSGPLEVAYRTCLWSRVASRVLLRLHMAPAATPEALYAATREIDWSKHLEVGATLAVDFDSTRSAITHTRFGALKVKDAIVDQLRELREVRPDVDTVRPDVRVSVRIVGDEAVFALDLAGESLHRRGWRGEGVAAPMKENLAATLLLRCGWPEIAAAGGAFVDPMCGSGTLPIEAALIATDTAPGLMREYYGFIGWAGHDAPLWERLREEARQRRAASAFPPGRIFGSDQDARAVAAARAATVLAGVAEIVNIERQPVGALRRPAERGLMLVNPPYGERLGEVDTLRPLYAELGAVMRERFDGWQAGVLTGNLGLGRELKLEARRRHKLFNGPIEVQLLRFDIAAEHHTRESRPGRLPPVDPAKRESPGAQMFANRLRKNLDALGKWARREQVSCFRVYDADMPEYSFAIDLYGDGAEGRYAFVQEYAAPSTVAEEKVRARRAEAVSTLPEVLGLDPDNIWFRTRRRRKGLDQYTKLASEQEFHEVVEGGLRFLVNFDDYQDTGIFLDHRLTRGRLRELASGKRFLNLFGYTGTASVYAAAGGAASTTTVDMSRTYLDWTRRNLELNGFPGREHVLVQADALEWLRSAPAAGWDLIFLDPPTFSNSKRMEGTLDVQRDHVGLLQHTARLLTPGGLLVFSTNYTRFDLEVAALPGLQIEDISRATIPKDFERNAKIHRCYLIRQVP